MPDLSKFKNIFVLEVEDQIEKLNKGLLSIEKGLSNGNEVDKTSLDNLMRASHTIKGSSASMGYSKMAFLTHVLEDVFDYARNGQLQLSQETINYAFSSIDNLEKSLKSIKEKDKEIDFDNFANELKEVTGVNTSGVGKSARDNSGKPVVERKKAPSKKSKEKNSQDNSEEDNAISKIDYIKVSVDRLDTLLDLVEELIIDKMRIGQMSEKYPDLKEVSDHIDLLISGIQYEVMQARLVPVDQVFMRFPRMVRDLSQKQKKKIDFQIEGGEIELDRTVVDRLGEPLVHLLRNAVDHGVEKSGKIKLQAERENDHVVFTVENKGKGIDYNRVKEVAVSRGIATSKEINEYDKKKLVNLLFHPNFSTNTKVTDVSGRGVGLSVVKGFIESFGGEIFIDSREDTARFVLRLPLTLAIIEALLVSSGGNKYAIPFSNIDRSVNVRRGNIKKMGDHDMAIVDGVNIPLLRLDSVLDREGEKDIDKRLKVVIIKEKKELAGIVVDEISSEQEIIVKPFSSVLQCIKGFSGSTILGDGSVVLILDVITLLKTVKINK